MTDSVLLTSIESYLREGLMVICRYHTTTAIHVYTDERLPRVGRILESSLHARGYCLRHSRSMAVDCAASQPYLSDLPALLHWLPKRP
jgi:thiamine phosphate synthase YjbQ (UPF0047 family)